MPIYISIMGQKGGVGKTTTAINMANLFHHREGLKTLAVDTDFQKSLSVQRSDETWHKKEKSFDIKTCVTEDPDTLHTMLSFFEQNYDVIVVDTPGKLKTGISSYLVEISDLIIVPFKPSNKDIKSNLQLIDAISNTFGDDVPVYGFFNMVKSNTKESEQIDRFKGFRCLKMLESTVKDTVELTRQSTYLPADRPDVVRLFDEIKTLAYAKHQKSKAQV